MPRGNRSRRLSRRDEASSLSRQLNGDEKSILDKLGPLIKSNVAPLPMSMSYVFKAKSPSSERGRLVRTVIAKTAVYNKAKQRRRERAKQYRRSLIGTTMAGTLNAHRKSTKRGGVYRAKQKGREFSRLIIEDAKKKAMSRDTIEALHPLFFSGNPGSKDTIIGVPINSNVRPVTDLTTVDTKCGFRYPMNHDEEDQILLLPRAAILEGHPRVKDLLNALDAAQDMSGSSLERGSERIVAFQSKGSKYINPGAYPDRGGKGITQRIIHKIQLHEWETLLKHVKYCENKAFTYLRSGFLAGFGNARLVVPFRTFPAPPGSEESKMFSAIAAAKDVCLNSHTDDDTIYSLVTPIDCNKSITFQMDDPICCYFTFPEIGIAIALRPGDILVFNPQTYHSVSSRADDAQHIWCLSLYLKTALVGGNDNSIQLNPLQQEIKKIAILK